MLKIFILLRTNKHNTGQEEVPWQEGADAQPVEDDVDQVVRVLRVPGVVHQSRHFEIRRTSSACK